MDGAANIEPTDRGRRMAELRVAAGLTQREVGEHFEVTGATVSHWERGIGAPDRRKLVELDRLYKADGEVLHISGIDEIDESRVKRLKAEIELLRATVEELDERLGRIERKNQPAPEPYVPSLTATAAAKLLGFNRHELKRLTDAGEVPHWRVTRDGRYVYSRGSLEEYEQRANP